MTSQSTLALISSALAEMVRSAVRDAAPTAKVKVSPPRAVAPSSGPEVNVCLFRIAPNPGFRNAALPLRDASGDQTQPDRIALDLHYLISFHGEEDMASERMAESVISQLDLFPTITEQALDELTGYAAPGHGPAKPLRPALLQPVRLTPAFMNLEELSKLWTVFFQVAHRLSLQYVASPVIFEAPDGGAVKPPPKVGLR